MPAPFLTNQMASEAGCPLTTVSIRWPVCEASNQSQALGDSSVPEARSDLLVFLFPGQWGP